MYSYLLEGGFKIGGKITASGNKNAALPCIVAALLTDEEVILDNVPDIKDVEVILQILKDIGVEALREGNILKIKALNIMKTELDSSLTDLIRASILLVGPILARCGRIDIAPPGGDVIGKRRLDTHFYGLGKLGAKLIENKRIVLEIDKLVGAEMFLDEASVTATENIIMAAVLAVGETVIMNAACEPHVQDLCSMLNAMGADISGIGSNMLRIKGVKKLSGTRFRIGADFMQVGSLISLSALTGGELEINKADPKNFILIRHVYSRLGINFEYDNENIYVKEKQSLKVKLDFGGHIPKIDDGPWPAFPTDLMSIMIVTATQVQGTVLIFEKMFESRMFFVDKLIKMGAQIVLCDPHRVVVTGKTILKGSNVSSPDVRAGMSLLIAALCAKGESRIQNVYQIERGYEDVVTKLSSLGAKIKRVKEQ
ncbi:UDP-N-acetylglucosamine 1-carboxyvinyltransferase [Borrelia hermsii]|nr:UDP-N-acetylglucosamine 1-carboxyvinyltransferase [Borrelia hermsii]AJW73275.1 UDP-N-acetylglucosamine 1-carboxyvinyltransferase [Borrelia hermsii CC1]AMR75372.1 UDP-N-acetylglucosamine 1-carboxyvinyltransferase [Borrelia hermsii]ANA43280.1 UDP-N-acetylglucosamine 1-carboxyvinyltransferase [Borrelia hermsii HS1]UCP01487.1 UDP-N-acetylglucosamine 1-carboxyvinyltransferase [Borrelia hermsii]UEQ07114.1 UDP-N-acetylglucosamine 1-carboxyvinyltransferase [Borrelia hermsii]